MTAFPQLGYSFKTNQQTIKNPPASFEAMEWMKNMDCESFLLMIRKEYSNWDKLSYFTQKGIAYNFYKNPERLYLKYKDGGYGEIGNTPNCGLS